MAKSEETYVPGNIINFEQRRKEYAERVTAEEVENAENALVDVLACSCGSTTMTMYTDHEYVMADCAQCGMPMLWPIIDFLRGDF